MKLLEMTSLSVADLKLGYSDGSCYYSGYGLTSLEGSPSYVNGDFDCRDNALVSLKGGPVKIDGDFSCSDNRLTSLRWAPFKVGGDFYCSNNHLTSLKGIHQFIEEIDGKFVCVNNPIRDGLEYILLIKGVTRVETTSDAFDDAAYKYLRTNQSGSIKAVFSVLDLLDKHR